jgi:hypothetical protein
VQSSTDVTSADTARQRRPSPSTVAFVSCRRSARAGGDDDVRAGLGQPAGEVDAEAGRGAGDDGDLAVEAEAIQEAHGLAP